jgi:hypothetical protein
MQAFDSFPVSLEKKITMLVGIVTEEDKCL